MNLHQNFERLLALLVVEDLRGDHQFIRAGALDDPGLIAPQATIWTGQAPDWACFDPAIPQNEGQPPPVA